MSNNIPRTIILLGDSLLDNFVPIEETIPHVTSKLKELNYNIHDFSIKELTLDQIFTGAKSDLTGQLIHPLSLLNVHGNIDDIVVLSIGGNDICNNVFRMILGIDALFEAVLTPQYLDLYCKLIERILESNKRLVLTTLYIPYMGIESSYKSFLPLTEKVVSRWSELIYKMASRYNIAVIDISKMLDCKNKDHYNETGIHFSEVTGMKIGSCLDYIYQNYEGSKVYYSFADDNKNIKIESLI